MRRFLVRLVKLGLTLATAGLLVLLVVLDQFGFADRAQKADAIVVLGSMVYPGGRLGPSLERRVEWAAALYKRGLAPAIICSGGIGTNPPAEAVVACARLIQLDVPETALLREDQSHNTEQNAAFTAAMLRAHNWHSVIVVSDGYHLYRVVQMFERTGMIVYPSPAVVESLPLSPLERVLREVREVAAVYYFWLRTWLNIDQTRPPQS
jgi:uncharacterized SAM-binding protein YcdF (DUF218 family)